MFRVATDKLALYKIQYDSEALAIDIGLNVPDSQREWRWVKMVDLVAAANDHSEIVVQNPQSLADILDLGEVDWTAESIVDAFKELAHNDRGLILFDKDQGRAVSYPAPLDLNDPELLVVAGWAKLVLSVIRAGGKTVVWHDDTQLIVDHRKRAYRVEDLANAT